MRNSLFAALGLMPGWSAPPVQPAPSAYTAPPDRFPPRLASLGYHIAFLNGAEVILPPVCTVPAGPYLMGSDPKKDKDARDNEKPQHSVTLAAFQIGKFPVTVAEYACFVRTGRREPDFWKEQLGKLDHPVGSIDWQDAMAYAMWLVERTGQPWQLPSEEQWEKTARGTDGRLYPWGDSFDASRCNTAEDHKLGTTPVGSYPNGASPYGALDMAGNVREWTSSLYKPVPYSFTGGRGAQAIPIEVHVLRGGSSRDRAASARAACIFFSQPNLGGFDFSYTNGFRLARAAPNS
jgi:formylglycine-generating enzyme required for sulfatase activity